MTRHVTIQASDIDRMLADYLAHDPGVRAQFRALTKQGLPEVEIIKLMLLGLLEQRAKLRDVTSETIVFEVRCAEVPENFLETPDAASAMFSGFGETGSQAHVVHKPWWKFEW